MKGAVLACDLCELRADLAWIIRTDRFSVVIGDETLSAGVSEVTRFNQDEEWGLCARCWADVQRDDQAAIIRRRREALVNDTGLSQWLALDIEQRAALMQVLDLTVMAVLACRQKAWGRAWTTRDEHQALSAIRRDGQRGKRP